MKTKNKLIGGIAVMLSLVLLLVTVFSVCRNTQAETLQANGRTVALADNALEASDYLSEFDSVERSEANNVYTYVAQKTFEKSSLSSYEELACDGETESEVEVVEYGVTIDAETGLVAVTAVFVEDGEELMDTLYGTVFYNEEDVLFNVDGESYSARELLAQSCLDECSIWGNILHAALNVVLKTISILEPSLTLTLACVSDVAKLVLAFGQVLYASNYYSNSKLSQPSGYVTDQGLYGKWLFGVFNLNQAGCEVIAGYNLAKAKGIDITLAQTAYLYESLGIEIGIAAGYFGSNPYQIWYYLNALNISYTTVNSYSTLESYIKNSTQYYMIVSRWNNTTVSSQIHTYFVDKYGASSMDTYNMKYKDRSVPANSASALFNESPGKTFIVAHLIKK